MLLGWTTPTAATQLFLTSKSDNFTGWNHRWFHWKQQLKYRGHPRLEKLVWTKTPIILCFFPFKKKMGKSLLVSDQKKKKKKVWGRDNFFFFKSHIIKHINNNSKGNCPICPRVWLWVTVSSWHHSGIVTVVPKLLFLHLHKSSCLPTGLPLAPRLTSQQRFPGCSCPRGLPMCHPMWGLTSSCSLLPVPAW